MNDNAKQIEAISLQQLLISERPKVYLENDSIAVEIPKGRSLNMANIFYKVMQTDYVDSHNQIYPVGVLEKIVRTVNENIVPLGMEHDPRIPAFGRAIMAWLFPLEDGHHVVIGLLEIFSDEIPLLNLGNRELVGNDISNTNITLIIDRNYEVPAYEQLVDDICKILNQAKPKHELKKSQDFLSILTLASPFIYDFAKNTLLSGIGDDIYAMIRVKLKSIFKLRQNDEKDSLLMLTGKVVNGDQEFSSELIIPNPTDENIDKCIDSHFGGLQDALKREIESTKNKQISRIVFELNEDKILLSYIHFTDGTVSTEKPQIDLAIIEENVSKSASLEFFINETNED